MDQIITGSGQKIGSGSTEQGIVQDIVQARAFHEKADKAFFRAFANPSGMLGRIASFMMARKNMSLNRAAVRILDPQPGEAVLEIGFGPGKGLELLLDKVGDSGSAAGVDISPMMVDKAAQYNKDAVFSGRMRLDRAAAHSIPWPDESFDRILSVSNIQFWQPASASFLEILRVMRSGGLFVAAIHTMVEGQRKMTPGLYPDEIKYLLEQLRKTGFSEIKTCPVPELPNELCIAGKKPSS